MLPVIPTAPAPLVPVAPTAPASPTWGSQTGRPLDPGLWRRSNRHVWPSATHLVPGAVALTASHCVQGFQLKGAEWSQSQDVTRAPREKGRERATHMRTAESEGADGPLERKPGGHEHWQPRARESGGETAAGQSGRPFHSVPASAEAGPGGGPITPSFLTQSCALGRVALNKSPSREGPFDSCGTLAWVGRTSGPPVSRCTCVLVSSPGLEVSGGSGRETAAGGAGEPTVWLPGQRFKSQKRGILADVSTDITPRPKQRHELTN